MAGKRLSVVIDADTSKFDKNVQGMKGTMDKATGGISSSLKNVQDSLGTVSENIGSAGSTMTKLVTGPIMALGAGIMGLMTQTGDYADRILDLSDITGMSTDAIQEWSYVADIAGVSGEAVTNAVAGLVRRLPQLETEGGKANDAMDKLGLSYEDLSKLSPDEQVDTLMNALSEMEDPLERNAAGSALFGGAWQDLAPILGMGAEEMANTREEAHELGAVMSEEALQDANDFRQEMERVKNELMGVVREVSGEFLPIFRDNLLPLIKDNLIPAFKDFAEWIGNIVQWFTELSPETQGMIGKFIAFMAVIGPILVVLAKVVAAIKVLVGVFTFLLSPVGLVIAIIAGLIAIGVLLWKNWDTVKEKASAIWGAIKDFFSETWESIKTKATETWEGLKTWFSETWNGIVEGAKGIWNSLKEFFSNTWNSMKETATNVWNGIKSFFVGLWDGIKNIFSTVGSAIASGISKVWNGIKTVTSAVWNGIKSAISAVWNGIKSVVSTAINNLSNNISRVWNLIKSVTSSIWNGIKSVISTVWNAIKSGVTSAINTVKSVISTVWNTIKSVTSSIWNGVKSVISGVWTGIKSGVSSAINSVKSTVSNVFNSVKSTITNIWNGIRDAIKKPINKARDIVKTAIDKIKGFMNFKWELPKLKMPSFSMSGKFSLNPPSVPKMGISWKAMGGIATGPSIVGIGEAGDEAILPLSNKSKMKPFAHAVASMMPNNGLAVAGAGGGGDTIITGNHFVVREEADIKKIAYELKRLDDRESRSRGRRGIGN